MTRENWCPFKAFLPRPFLIDGWPDIKWEFDKTRRNLPSERAKLSHFWWETNRHEFFFTFSLFFLIEISCFLLKKMFIKISLFIKTFFFINFFLRLILLFMPKRTLNCVPCNSLNKILELQNKSYIFYTGLHLSFPYWWIGSILVNWFHAIKKLLREWNLLCVSSTAL